MIRRKAVPKWRHPLVLQRLHLFTPDNHLVVQLFFTCHELNPPY